MKVRETKRLQKVFLPEEEAHEARNLIWHNKYTEDKSANQQH